MKTVIIAGCACTLTEQTLAKLAKEELDRRAEALAQAKAKAERRATIAQLGHIEVQLGDPNLPAQKRNDLYSFYSDLYKDTYGIRP